MNQAMPVVEMFGWYAAFVLSATVHEAAHAWAAKRGGDLTAYLGGQVSLDPRPHIQREPFGMVILPIISMFLIQWPFGYASAPYDPLWAHEHPKKAGWMAAAGPLANLAMVLIIGVLFKVGLATGVFTVPMAISPTTIVDGGSNQFAAAAQVLSILFSMNLILLVLNLLPLPPLDGSGVITIFLKEDTARRYQEITRTPMFGIIGLLLAWWVFGPVFRAVFFLVVQMLYRVF